MSFVGYASIEEIQAAIRDFDNNVEQLENEINIGYSRAEGEKIKQEIKKLNDEKEEKEKKIKNSQIGFGKDGKTQKMKNDFDKIVKRLAALQQEYKNKLQDDTNTSDVLGSYEKKTTLYAPLIEKQHEKHEHVDVESIIQQENEVMAGQIESTSKNIVVLAKQQNETVHGAGEKLGEIEKNVEVSVQNMKVANTELAQAKENSQKSKKTLIKLLTCCLFQDSQDFHLIHQLYTKQKYQAVQLL